MSSFLAQIDVWDAIVLVCVGLGAIWFFQGKLFGTKESDLTGLAGSKLNGAAGGGAAKTRNIIEKMDESDKNAVIFYGSQTGTAEDYASRLAKEGHARFGLKTMVADLEDYDFENLDVFPEDKIAIFVLATYGEGEPTDNAVAFYEFVTDESTSYSEGGDANSKALSNFRFVIFGLGNSTYEQYNSMVRRVNTAFINCGAKRIGTAGEGDDGAGSMEEDFLAWKEPMWEELKEAMNLEEREAIYEPVLGVTEKPELSADDDTVYLGEPNKNHLEGHHKGPYNAHNPYVAPITMSKELFQVKGRNCLHMEIDISGASNMSYTTGDHIAIWPTNSGFEVDRMLSVLGLLDKRHTVIAVRPLDTTAKVPFPTPTTYDAVIRYHLEINGVVSRQFVASLSPFAPTEEAKAEFTKLGGDKDYFQEKVTSRYLNIAQLLESVAGVGVAWPAIPFSLIIEGISHIQVRYYSISSSSLVSKDKVAITAVVESIKMPGNQHVLKGVTTNYLLSLSLKQHGVAQPDPHGLTYAITGPRNKYDGIHVPVHIRHSNFKLPSDPSKPIIMIGPGTGVAPFRGFVQERAKQKENGAEVGMTVLFFGCRKRDEDFLYDDEWKTYANTLGSSFQLVTAFSREQSKKIYVQHRLEENGPQINELLKKGAYFYVCGDAANMAREVNVTLARIISKERAIPISKAEDIVKSMRSSNLYQEDVWS